MSEFDIYICFLEAIILEKITHLKNRCLEQKLTHDFARRFT